MDFYWPVHNASSYLDIIQEVLAQRKTFLNFDGTQYYLLLSILLLLKCLLSGYGMVKLVPDYITYMFMFLQISVNFFVVESWSYLAGEILHAFAQTGVLLWLHEAEENMPSLPNVVIWYFYSQYHGTEFFLDCYVIATLLAFVWKAYATRPHRLSLLICLLYTVNWLADQFVREGTTSVFQNLILFYVPVILMESLNPTADFSIFPDAYVALWVIYKLSKTNFEETPAAKYKELVETNLRDMNFTDILDEIGKRKSFLNVNENEHYVVFNLLLLLKSFMAAYAVRNIVGLFTTLKMMIVNCILTIFDRNVRMALAGLLYFILIAGYQFVFCMQEYRTAINSGIWFWVSSDDHFHFFLDVFLIVSALIYIDKAYEGDLDKISTLMCLLFFVDWFSDKLTGDSLGKVVTIATLYLPVLLLSASKALKGRYRVLSMVVFILLWFVYRLKKEYFAYCVNEYINNFYEILKTFIMYLNGVLYQ